MSWGPEYSIVTTAEGIWSALVGMCRLVVLVLGGRIMSRVTVVKITVYKVTVLEYIFVAYTAMLFSHYAHQT